MALQKHKPLGIQLTIDTNFAEHETGYSKKMT
jgi:hypothetical protein